MRIRSVQSGYQNSRSDAVDCSYQARTQQWQHHLKDQQQEFEDLQQTDRDQIWETGQQKLFTQLLDLATERRQQAAGQDLHKIDLQLGVPDQGGQLLQIGLLDRRLSIALGFYLDQLYQQRLPELVAQAVPSPSIEAHEVREVAK